MDLLFRPASSAGALLIVVCALVLAASSYGEALPSSRYSEVTDTKREHLTSWEQFRPGGSLLTSVSSNGDRHEVSVDRRLRTRSWTFSSPSRRIDIRAVRRGERIEISGTFRGTPIERTVTIDPAPWYQSIERSLAPLALGHAGGRELFWVVEPYTLTPRKMQAVRGGDGIREVEGRPTRVAAITVSLPGFLAPFWHSTYWFRLSDGKFVRFEGLHGPPGTPLTVVQLESETP